MGRIVDHIASSSSSCSIVIASTASRRIRNEITAKLKIYNVIVIYSDLIKQAGEVRVLASVRSFIQIATS